MELRILGPLEVRVDGGALPIRTGRPRKLLVALVLRLGERVSSDTLIDLLWPAEEPGNRVNALQILISYLRKTLRVAGEALRIETVEAGYRLRAARADVDAYRLEAVVAGVGDVADPRMRLAGLDDALASWRGPPIPEIASEEFAQADLQRLNDMRLAALELRLDALLALGRHVEAAMDLQRLVVVHPLRERFYAQLMTALYRSGRQADALGVYERARRLLVEELGVDPGPELQAVAQAVLRHSPQLQASTGVRAATAMPKDEADDAEAPPSPAPFRRPLESLIGREGDMIRLRELLASHRLITLTGPGGAGKTRLAAELAAETPGTTWWVDLSQVEGQASVLATVARSMGLKAEGDDDGSALAASLVRRDGLLVLDTCERVRVELRPLVEAVLRGCPGVRLLATSRQPLAAATEVAWPVPPLSLPDPHSTSVDLIQGSAAARLFVERAGNRRPGFELTRDNCVDVARVCLLLDGLPLAIELAAAHAAALDMSVMVRVLDDRLRLLVDESRESRQHTLRSTIAWSHELLSGDEAVFFERLSVFAGPFPLDAAVFVAGDDLGRDGLELLLALVRQSLVAVDGGGRYRLLDTIRAFALELLRRRGQDQEDTRRRHATWYADLLSEAAPALGSANVEGWRGELRDAAPDLRRAMDWCFSCGEDELGARLLASLWWLWPREGAFEEAAHWFPRAREAVPHGTALQADLLASSGTHAVSRGDLRTAADECSAAAQLYERLGYRRSLARVLIAFGIAHWGQGDHSAAADAHERAAELFGESGDRWGRGLAMVLRARTALDAAEPDAMSRLASAEMAARESGDLHVLAAALVQRARAEITAGRHDDAHRHAEESLRLNERHGHHEGAIGSLHALGLAHLGLHDPGAALDLFTRALRAALAMHHAGATAESLDCLAIASSRLQRWTDAARLLAAADHLRRRTAIQRSPLITQLVTETAEITGRHLDAAVLEEARRAGLVADLADLADLAVHGRH